MYVAMYILLSNYVDMYNAGKTQFNTVLAILIIGIMATRFLAFQISSHIMQKIQNHLLMGAFHLKKHGCQLYEIM